MHGTYRKIAPLAPAAYLAWEGAGLVWLADVPDGAPIVRLLAQGETYLDLAYLDQLTPSPAAAQALGVGLARTHAAGAPAYGAPPPGWESDGFLGPSDQPLPLLLTPTPTWPTFWAEQRILPLLKDCRDGGLLSHEDTSAVEVVVRRVLRGEFDTGEPPARLHGDLWSGNVLWGSDVATLVDPAAHGGHREADLAMMALFGFPYLPLVLAAYDATVPLADGWRQRVGLHQLHPLLLHVLLFGTSFRARTLAVAREYA